MKHLSFIAFTLVIASAILLGSVQTTHAFSLGAYTQQVQKKYKSKPAALTQTAPANTGGYVYPYKKTKKQYVQQPQQKKQLYRIYVPKKSRVISSYNLGTYKK